MMEAEESQPTVGTKKGETETMASTPKQPPPAIQLDEAKPDNANHPAEKRDADEKSFEQLRTPKHANKTTGSGARDGSSPTGRGFSRDDAADESNQKITPERAAAEASKQQPPNYPTQEKAQYEQGQRGAPGQDYHAPGGEGYGQFRGQQGPQDPHQASYYAAARARMMQQGGPQTISPGGSGMTAAGAYRAGASGYGAGAAAYAMQAGRYQQEGFRQGDYSGYRGQGQYGYQDTRYGYGDGSRHPQYGQGIAGPYQGQQRHAHFDPRYGGQQGPAFTRAVSNSFDRSTKGAENTTARSSDVTALGSAGKADQATSMQPMYYPRGPSPNVPDSNASVPDDHSWGQLNQVASVDDAMLARARIEQNAREQGKAAAESEKDKEIRQPPSTSSSLTNSPTEGHEAVVEGKPNLSPSKMAPLDSLSSVASAQEPMDTTGSKDGKDSKPAGTGGPSSPNSSNGSLDLMKCHSGSSGLLHSFPGTHGRSMSGSSFLLDSKRSRDFGAVGEGARHTPTDGPLSKKSKLVSEVDKAKSENPDRRSPLPVECSPPGAASDKRSGTSNQADNAASLQGRVSAAAAGRSSTSPAYMGVGSYPNLDRAPSYTYSIDSVPSKEYAYPPLPRQGSSSSSTIMPSGGSAMQAIDGPLASTDANNRQDSLVGALPSWDILHAQDSFGAGSVGAGGAPIVGNFSFSQDYPLLSASGSNLGINASQSGMNPAQAQTNQQVAQQPGRHHGPPTSLAESRNQSFEGGQYHGGATDASYTGAGKAQTGAAASQYQQEGYKNTGQYPPQAPSWGTTTSSNSTQPTHGASSYQAAQLAQQYRNTARSYQTGNVMRNYSEESAARTSPPAEGSFLPPSDFVAPRHPALRRPPPQAVYIMSSDGRKKNDTSRAAKSSAGGVYGWSKEEDDHLTDVMKKFKNPRDWEPIAKEHGYNKTAKECHERWIRYLKPGVRKGQWTDHEDAIVVEAVSESTEQPFTRWSDLAQKLPGRVGKQIRDRWVNHLNPNINHMPFSKEDDLLLWEGHKQLGKRWVEISTKFFNSSRSENHIKNRWYSASFKKFIANEFGPNAHSGGGKGSAKKKKSTPKPTATAQV